MSRRCDKSSSSICVSADSQLQNKGGGFHRETLMNVFTHVAKKAARAALRVVVAVRGDDVVGRVAQLMAHEAPRHAAWLRIGLHADGEGQALTRAHLDGSVVNETRVHESFIWEERRKLLFTQNLQNIGVKSTAVVERNRANPHTV